MSRKAFRRLPVVAAAGLAAVAAVVGVVGPAAADPAIHEHGNCQYFWKTDGGNALLQTCITVYTQDAKPLAFRTSIRSLMGTATYCHFEVAYTFGVLWGFDGTTLDYPVTDGCVTFTSAPQSLLSMLPANLPPQSHNVTSSLLLLGDGSQQVPVPSTGIYWMGS